MFVENRLLRERIHTLPMQLAAGQIFSIKFRASTEKSAPRLLRGKNMRGVFIHGSALRPAHLALHFRLGGQRAGEEGGSADG